MTSPPPTPTGTGDSPHDEDRLHLEERRGLELPGATLDALIGDGVPRELALPDWEGPTLFSSELTSGRLISTTEPGALIERRGEHEGYVLGAVRDRETKLAYSAFVLRKGIGDVWLLDATRPEDDRFVNGSLDAFLASMHAFHTAFPHLVDTLDESERRRLVASFRALLTKLDPRALETPEHYWPGWIEELEAIS